MKKRNAFTLAEVLITLGIIGIVAAMTLPVITASIKESIAINQLKTTYSLLSKAVLKTISDNGTLDTWSDDSVEYLEQEFNKALKVIHKCEGSYSSHLSCIDEKASGMYLYSSNIFVLSNGASYQVRLRNPNGKATTSSGGKYCSASLKKVRQTPGVTAHYYYCAQLIVDINGKRKPNKAGEDIFDFRVFTDGILPSGMPRWDVASDSFESCKNGTTMTQCTAWVILNNNMDYLHCKDVDWDTKTTCK